jgi:hypothetical protein
MNYAIYKNKPDTEAAEKAADAIIEKFLEEMEGWCEKYRHVGASDTASREAFAINTACRLRLLHYYPANVQGEAQPPSKNL